MNHLFGTSMLNELRIKAIEEGKAIEIKEDVLLFHTLDPKRQEGETFEEYKFRRLITKKSIKKHFKR